MEQQKMSGVIVKYLVSCIIYSVISHLILDVSYPNLNILESSVRSLVIYSVMFTGYAAIPILITILVAKVSKPNRAKTFSGFFNAGLIFAWIIALVFLYGGWYGQKAIS